MYLIDALRGGTTLADLNNKYAIGARRHGRYPNLVLLKYNQIDSPMGEPIVQECRGIILDESNNWNVVSRPFDKFFNAAEGHAAQIDWSTASFYEKLDGSLCTIYYYNGEWHIATSGTPDAASGVNDYGFTFAELFWKTFWAAGYKLPENKNVCYMFELMTPYNQIVVRHNFNRLVLIGARDLTTGSELHVDQVDGYERVARFSLASLADAEDSFKHIDPTNQEGYVVVDAQFNRVKVKHPGYVALHHMKSGMSMRRLLEVVMAGEVSEVVAHFPEYEASINDINNRITAMRDEIAADFNKYSGLTDRKQFALAVAKTKFAAAMFSLFSGKVKTVDEYIKTLRIESLYDYLGLKGTGE